MKRKNPKLSLKRLKEVLDYNPVTGNFRWKMNLRRRKLPSKISAKADGYIRIGIDGAIYKAHRLAWFYFHGTWPEDQIDHINLDRSDNRIANLREATNQLNVANIKARSTNKSGYKGASFHKFSGLYMARITVNGQAHALGYFKTAKEANGAYLLAAQNHFKEFARAS